MRIPAGPGAWPGWLCAAALALGAEPSGAQDDGFIRVQGARAGDTVAVAAGDYAAGGLHRFFFGTRYRDLWTAPIRVPVLDLARAEGGLTPEKAGGGMQTRSLRFRAADGREFAFRSVDKDPVATLPEALRGSIAEDVFRDQISAGHPAGALVVSPILEAAGIPHAEPRLYVLPDDPRLGEFRAAFGGMLGTLELRPTEAEDGSGFAGALDVKSTDKFLEELAENPAVPVDDRAYLAARMIDFLVGDWDRHEDQWRWALVDDRRGRRWIPIPRDRDQAFSRYDGLLLGVARRIEPKLLDYGPDYAGPVPTTWNGRNLDRRLLVELERGVWDSTARAVQAAVTDAVLDRAVGRQPPEYAAEAPRLREALAARRAGLAEFAGQVYGMLAREPDINATALPDRVAVERGGERTAVTIHAAGVAAPVFHRTFLDGETGELRIYLGDGADTASVTGGDGPRVRVIGEGGADRMTAAPGTGSVNFYDEGDRTVAEGAALSDQPAPTPPPARDWGNRTTVDAMVRAAPDFGVVPSVRVRWNTYGFRQAPFARRVALTGAYSTGQAAPRVLLEVEDPLESSSTWLTFRALASGFEAVRFYGVGNGTTDEGDQEFFRVTQQAYEVRPGIRFGGEGTWEVDLGIAGRVVRTDPDGDNADRIIGLVQPLGTGTVGRAGAVFSVERDTRDVTFGPRRGALLRVSAEEWPTTWGDDDGAFGSATIGLQLHASPGDGPVTLSGHAGGKGTWGEPPFDELAFLGGFRTLRGYRQNRFAGDQAAFGGVDVRLRLARFRSLVPGEFGVFGAGEVGRVFTTADDSETWHRSAGGGGYFAFVDRTLVLLGGAAASVEGTLFYFGIGFPD